MKICLLGLIGLVLISCSNQNNYDQSRFLPIDSTELKYKKGDCISFKIDSINIGVAIVIDYSKDEGGLWYGLCFTDFLDSIQPEISMIKKQRLYGRKIESSFDKNGFVVGLDILFVNDSCFRKQKDQFKLIGRVNLNNVKIKFGSEGALSEYVEMISSFKNGREKRKTPPDNYRDHNKKLNDFRPDEYFLLRDYLDDK